MQFAPKTKEELNAQQLLVKGWYDFEVMHAEEAVSKKSGKEMIKLKLRVFDSNGGERHIYDYLIETAASHLFDFCESVGLTDKYEAGTLTADDCIGRAAQVKIGIDDKDPNYQAKNVAKDYGIPKERSFSAPKVKVEPDDDEIPF